MYKKLFILLLLTLCILSFTLPASAGRKREELVQVHQQLISQIDPEQLESFIFFTDPHCAEYPTDPWKYRFHALMWRVRLVQRDLGVSSVFSGGDWIGNSDTNEEAYEKLSFITQSCLNMFGAENFHSMVGNHDINEQGAAEATEPRIRNTAVMSVEEYTSAMFPGQETAYYAFDGQHTRFFVLDSGSGSTSMTAKHLKKYRWNQVSWLASSLIEEDPEHAAIAMHLIHTTVANDSYGAFAENILEVCEAYNNRVSIAKNGRTYDFSACTGHVEFAFCGHNHVDYSTVYCGIPIINTMKMTQDTDVAFDVFDVDYGSRKIYILRYGLGNDREISLPVW